MDLRRLKGELIVKKSHIEKHGDVWKVLSQSGKGFYSVKYVGDFLACNCPYFELTRQRCKHIYAVEIQKSRCYDWISGKMTEIKKTSYKQDWPNYTKAQNEEGKLFNELLKDLVENIEEPVYTFGRPKLSLKTALFCAIDKVYSMQSSRRAYSRYKEAEAKQQISKTPSYNAINKVLNNANITPLLQDLLNITALPLKSVETNFSSDSTGFRTSRFSDYCEIKHGVNKEHAWVKCHAMTGNTTNIITSAVITSENGADSLQFIPLLNATNHLGFTISEVTADKAYNSIDNYNAVQEIGGVAYIPFKSNVTAPVRTGFKARLWRKMFHYFQLHQDEFYAHYHKRSNVETTFFAIKAKFGDSLKNKNLISQTNELLCKLIAYNITVLINAMFELKIEPQLLPA